MIYFLFLTLFLLGCPSLTLRGDGLKIPFKKGSVSFDLLRIEYPGSLSERQRFFDEIYHKIVRVVEENRKITLMLDDDFFYDMESVEKNGLLVGEGFLEMAASEMGKKDREMLCFHAGVKNRKMKVRELLNLQIKTLLKIADREGEFDESKTYVERDKEEIIDLIKKRRRLLLKMMKNSSSHINLVAQISDPYLKIEDKKVPKGYYSKRIELSKNNLSVKAPPFCDGVAVGNLPVEKLESILSGDIDLGVNSYILLNEKYQGYIFLGEKRVIFLVGGEEEIFSFSGHKCLIGVRGVELDKLAVEDGENILNDVMPKG